MFRVLLAATLLATGSTALAETPQVTNYLGSIGSNLPVSMALEIDHQSRVSGSYVYSQYGKPISLTGSRSYETTRHADITMKEADPGTGTFQLTVARDDALSGAWKSSDGQRTLPVSLSPAAKTITLVSARSDRYEVRIGYLQLTAQTPFARALNARVEKSALDSHAKSVQSLVADTDSAAAEADDTLPHTLQATPFLLYASDTLVSIRDRVYSYSGGAHGNWGYGAQNYAWVGGALVQVEPEMIVPQSQWPALRAMCIRELKAQGASWPQDIELDAKAPPELNFTSRGLLVVFNPYEAGSYAEGAYILSLPYEKLKGLIPPAGPLAPLAAN